MGGHSSRPRRGIERTNKVEHAKGDSCDKIAVRLSVLLGDHLSERLATPLFSLRAQSVSSGESVLRLGTTSSTI